jgi:hypothetical protein
MMIVNFLKIVMLAVVFLVLFSCESEQPTGPESGNFTIFGEVFYKHDQSQKLDDVKVQVNQKTTFTDSIGLFKIDNLKRGSERLKLTHANFAALDTLLQLNENKFLKLGMGKKQPEIFPNEVGYWWKYERYDSLVNEKDTVLIEIVGKTSFEDKETEYMHWEINYSESNKDIHRVEHNSDSINFPLGGIIKFPVEVGDSTGVGSVIKYKVEAYENISVPFGNFNNAARIYYVYDIDPHIDNVTYLWFVERVGVVKWHYKSAGSVKLNVVYNLIDMQLE